MQIFQGRNNLYIKLSGLLIMLAIMAAMSPVAYAMQGMEEAMANVNSPEDIANFFAQEFDYNMTLPDRAHTPEQTIASHSGDCEDFAILASAMLTRMGIENQVLIINFNGIRLAHAICIWQAKDGTYSFISNRELYRSGQRSVEATVKKFYPDCNTIASIDPKMYLKNCDVSDMASAKSYIGADLMADLDPRRAVDL